MPRLARYFIAALATGILFGCAGQSVNPVSPSAPSGASPYAGRADRNVAPRSSAFTFVKIPTSNSIQSDLVNTFPKGTFTAKNALKTQFHIPAKPRTCGFAKNSACNFYDAFTYESIITIHVSIPHPTHAFTLMNAYSPPAGQEIAAITFVGSNGDEQSFQLIGGKDIRDFYHGDFANTLNNGVTGVVAKKAFTCDDPTNCKGAAGTGNVNSGLQGTYNLDEQEYTFTPTFSSQNLVSIVIEDTNSSSTPILLGLTVQ